MAQSQASMLRGLSFFSSGTSSGGGWGGLGGLSGNSGWGSDSVDFSQAAIDASMYASIIQGGNSAIFGSLYEDAEAFNQSLLSSVTSTAGFNFGSDSSLLGQLVNQVA